MVCLVHPGPSFLLFIIPQNQCYVSRPSLSVKGVLPFSALTGAENIDLLVSNE